MYQDARALMLLAVWLRRAQWFNALMLDALTL
jgi:hypothetical protein